MILGLDLGATTGWAIADDEQKENPIIKSGHKRVADKKIPALRFINFISLLDELKKQINQEIKCIYYEYVYMPHKSTEAAYAYGGYKACLEVWADKNRTRIQGILCSSARKNILGNGGLNKNEAFIKIKEIHPDAIDHNQADAILITMYALIADQDALFNHNRKKKEKGEMANEVRY